MFSTFYRRTCFWTSALTKSFVVFLFSGGLGRQTVRAAPADLSCVTERLSVTEQMTK